jgi:thymidylate synthase (FAD)
MSNVKLVSFTRPSDEIQNNGINDIKDIISFCARVSNPSNQFNTQTSDKLLNYLLKNKHISPFEMANICLEIETTRDIARQILRHRSMNFQEFSQRYNDPVKELNFTLREVRLQDQKNRQNSIETDDIELQNALWFLIKDTVKEIIDGDNNIKVVEPTNAKGFNELYLDWHKSLEKYL